MDRRLRRERLRQVALCELTRIERADPLLQDERAGERLLHRHLLVDREADEQRERIMRQELAGLGIVGEPERVGHMRSLLVDSHRDRADVPRAALLQRQELALAAVDEDRVLRVANVPVVPRAAYGDAW